MTYITFETSLSICNKWQTSGQSFKNHKILIISSFVYKKFWKLWRNIIIMPELEILIVNNKDIDYLPMCPKIKVLNIDNCISISKLPNNLINLTHLNINNTNIDTIPFYPKIKYISCNDCYNLTKILSKPINISANFCYNLCEIELSEITDTRNTQTISVIGCKNLKCIITPNIDTIINTYGQKNFSVYYNKPICNDNIDTINIDEPQITPNLNSNKILVGNDRLLYRVGTFIKLVDN